MLAVYLACFAAGGFVILLSVFGGADGDADVDVDTDVDTDLDFDGAGDGDGTGDTGTGDTEGSGEEATSEGSVSVARLLSLRNAVFFTGFFGMSGTLSSLLGTAPAPTLAVSIVSGLLAAASIQMALDYLRRSQSGALPEPAALAGARARVLVGATRASLGKVEVEAAEGTQQLVARVHAESGVDHFEPGDAVVIVRVDGGQALVAEKTFFS
jgi:hypothetical protein